VTDIDTNTQGVGLRGTDSEQGDSGGSSGAESDDSAAPVGPAPTLPDHSDESGSEYDDRDEIEDPEDGEYESAYSRQQAVQSAKQRQWVDRANELEDDVTLAEAMKYHTFRDIDRVPYEYVRLHYLCQPGC
jgi:hypothetical protein